MNTNTFPTHVVAFALGLARALSDPRAKEMIDNGYKTWAFGCELSASINPERYSVDVWCTNTTDESDWFTPELVAYQSIEF